LDISCAGRGAQQTLLLLTYIQANPGAVLLLDEPDAHLEVLRQRQIFNKLVELVSIHHSQIIAASHSEVVLNEAADRNTVIVFIGKPHDLTLGKKSQVVKALHDIGFDQYYQAEQKGWVLYLEDSTDFLILQALARKLNHPALQHLELPFVHYVGTNLPQKAREHFYGIREAKPDLRGIALFDRIEKNLQSTPELVEIMWKKREIENYFCKRNVLLSFAEDYSENNSNAYELGRPEFRKRMDEAITKMEDALRTLGKPSPWSDEIKATDEFLDPLFAKFSEQLSPPLLCLRKNAYSKLVDFLDKDEIDAEVTEKLDAIVRIANQASHLPQSAESSSQAAF
jgi:hypothetical protein